MRRHIPTLIILLSLLPNTALAAVRGVVISADGVALQDVKVTAYALEASAERRERLIRGTQREPIAAAVSDAKGIFTVDAKDASVFDLMFQRAGHAPASLRVSKDEDVGAVLLRAAADRTGIIRAGGNPLPEVSVVFGLRNEGELIVRTDENGRYVVPDPDQWADTMTVLHPDFARSVASRRPPLKWSMDVALTKGVAISGRVVATDGKSPVAGARILVDGWHAGESGEDGSFSVPNLPSNWTELRAVKAEQLASRTRVTGSTSVLRMSRASTLRGTVTESGSRRPVAGVAITLSRPGQQATQEWIISDSKGNFSLASMTPGTFQVLLSVPGYTQQAASDVSVAAGETVSRPLIVSRGGSLEGVVLDENGKPVSAAGVAADRRPPGMPRPPLMFIRDGSRAFTAPDGRFVIRNLAPGEGYNVQANREGFAEGRETGVEITASERKSGVRITLPSGYELAGRVADQRGRGIAGATIVATKTLPEARAMRRAFFFSAEIEDGPTSSADGSFSLRLAEGSYDIEFRREGFAPRQLPSVRVERNNDPLSVVLVEGVAVAGRVVTAGGSPVADAGVTLHSTELGVLGTTMTSVDGSFAFDDLAAGAATLSVTKTDDFIQFSQPVKAPDSNVLVELPAGGGVAGRVVDKSSKQPLTSFSAGLSGVRGGGMRTGPPMMKEFRSDDGSFVLENVPVGQHQIQVFAPGYVTARMSGVNVEEGSSVRDLEVLMEPGVRVTGKVTGPDGAGLESVFIQSEDPGDRMPMGPSRPMTTDADGEYAIEGLPAGERTLRFNKQGYVPEQKAVKISGKEARVDVRLSRGLEVKGTVVDASGRPVSEATVMAQAPGSGARASTDSNGAFTIEGLTAGRYSITATKKGMANEVLRDVDIATAGHLRLVLDAGGTIYGRVSGHDETLASSIIVRASSREGNAQSSIDVSGNFRIEGAPLGTVTVFAAARGSNSPSKQVDVVSGQSYQVDLEFRNDIVISGRVTRDGRAARLSFVSFLPSNARLQSRGSGTTDADGYYTVSGLEPGEYNVNVMDQSSLQPFRTKYTVTSSANFDIDVRGATLRGRVVDAETGEGIADARILLSQPDSRTAPMMSQPATVSAYDGNFMLDNVPAGSYQLLAQKQGWGHQIVDVSVEGQFAQDTLVKLSKNDGLVLRVVDARDGRALSPSLLVSDASNRVAYQGFGDRRPDGSTRISIATGTYRVAVGAGGYATRTVSVAAPGESSVALSPGGTVSVTLADSERQLARLLLPGGEAYLRNPWSINADFALNPGSNILANILPGSYTLVVLDEKGQVKKSEQVTVTEGQTTDVRM